MGKLGMSNAVITVEYFNSGTIGLQGPFYYQSHPVSASVSRVNTYSINMMRGCSVVNAWNYAVSGIGAQAVVLDSNVIVHVTESAVNFDSYSTNAVLTSNVVIGMYRSHTDLDSWVHPSASYYLNVVPLLFSNNVATCSNDAGLTMRMTRALPKCLSMRRPATRLACTSYRIGLILLGVDVYGWTSWKNIFFFGPVSFIVPIKLTRLSHCATLPLLSSLSLSLSDMSSLPSHDDSSLISRLLTSRRAALRTSPSPSTDSFFPLDVLSLRTPPEVRSALLESSFEERCDALLHLVQRTASLLSSSPSSSSSSPSMCPLTLFTLVVDVLRLFPLHIDLSLSLLTRHLSSRNLLVAMISSLSRTPSSSLLDLEGNEQRLLIFLYSLHFLLQNDERRRLIRCWSFQPILQCLNHSQVKVRYLAVENVSVLLQMNALVKERCQQQWVYKAATHKVSNAEDNHSNALYMSLALWHEILGIQEESQSSLVIEHELQNQRQACFERCRHINDDSIVQCLLQQQSASLKPSSPSISNSRYSNLSFQNLTSSQSSAAASLLLLLQKQRAVLLTGEESSGKTTLLHHVYRLYCSGTTFANSPFLPLLTLHIDETVDSKTLLGSYVCTDKAGEFRWSAGSLISAVQSGRGVLIEDIDRANFEVMSTLETLLVYGTIFVRGELIRAHPYFRVMATRNNSIKLISTTTISPMHAMLNRLFFVVSLPALSRQDMLTIIVQKFVNIPHAVHDIIMQCFDVLALKTVLQPVVLTETTWPSSVVAGPRHLFRWCRRLEFLFSSHRGWNAAGMNDSFANALFQTIVQVFFSNYAHCASSDLVNSKLEQVSRIWRVPWERVLLHLTQYAPLLQLSKDAITIGSFSIPHHATVVLSNHRSFTDTKHSLRLSEKILSCVYCEEPVLLTGETGCGKTSVLQHLAELAGRQLIVINMNNQSDSSDLLGGFRPVNISQVCMQLARDLVQPEHGLFTSLMSRTQNGQWLDVFHKMLKRKDWLRALKVMQGLAKKATAKYTSVGNLQAQTKVQSTMRSLWQSFEEKVTKAVNHAEGVNEQIASNSKKVPFFHFVEGAMISALREGHWLLLDEINLSNADTLERISGLLDGSDSSLTLTERGDVDILHRASSFRLFAAMNPSSDIGKRDLPSAIKSRFSEIRVEDVTDVEDLEQITSHYLEHPIKLGELHASSFTIHSVVSLYIQIQKLSQTMLSDGAGQKPHFSLRTYVRCLQYASLSSSVFGLVRALREGFNVAFCSSLSPASILLVEQLLNNAFGDSNTTSSSRLLNCKLPDHVVIEGFPLSPGLHNKILDSPNFIITPTVQIRLHSLARVLVHSTYPILLQGPTSAGKTSVVTFLANRLGHKLVRINNHAHTDISEYLGTYTNNQQGQLVFVEGALVQAVRQGWWLVLDELNLAPSDVLEVLNRLLDDHRQLFLPETQEMIEPHPHFRVFATQNPAGHYAGRKQLSRAFVNRFVTFHLHDLPYDEMIVILERRCLLPRSIASKIVSIMRKLQMHRDHMTLFQGKMSLITPRDLLRWSARLAATSQFTTQAVGDIGYMVLAEKLRNIEAKQMVKSVLENECSAKAGIVRINTETLYSMNAVDSIIHRLTNHRCRSWSECMALDDFKSELVACNVGTLVWTAKLRRLLVLTALSLLAGEPVLLVGNTGCGKTSVVQILACLLSRPLTSINCHLNTETSDFIGSLRPVRNKGSSTLLVQHLHRFFSLRAQWASLTNMECRDQVLSMTPDMLKYAIDIVQDVVTKLSNAQAESVTNSLNELKGVLEIGNEILLVYQRASRLFEWCDGPLLTAMKHGHVFLVDEISLADDAVLERLNPVLETERSLLVTEQGTSLTNVTKAHDSFCIVATMNPGGDYGKKELSPALRNRMTEVWVETADAASDLAEIAVQQLSNVSQSMMREKCVNIMLSFINWYNDIASTVRKLTLRDLVSWCYFVRETHVRVGLFQSTIHGLCVVVLDGLAAGSKHSLDAAMTLRQQCTEMILDIIKREFDDQALLSEAAVLLSSFQSLQVETSDDHLSPFSVPPGPLATNKANYSFDSITPQLNLLRLSRAMQLPKAILLEGDPGVGKSSLVSALASMNGYPLIRINLSEQTEMSDLLGADLPTAGAPGHFHWCDGSFLKALKEGFWVLLDELNLASQSVLEGLNAVLDHRGQVDIPELGLMVKAHPRFRIFASQNSSHQGGGRKALPASFLNRFSKVYLSALNDSDLLAITHRAFPELPITMLEQMIQFNTQVQAYFDYERYCFEFNLRDLFRWCELLRYSQCRNNYKYCNPGVFVDLLYLQRMRSNSAREAISQLYDSTFYNKSFNCGGSTWCSLSHTKSSLKIGYATLSRVITPSILPCEWNRRLSPLARSSFSTLSHIAKCIQHNFPCIVVSSSSESSDLIRHLAQMCNRRLSVLSVGQSMDSTDLLGSYEQVDCIKDKQACLDHLNATIHLAMSMALTSSGLEYSDDLKLEMSDVHFPNSTTDTESLSKFRKLTVGNYSWPSCPHETVDVGSQVDTPTLLSLVNNVLEDLCSVINSFSSLGDFSPEFIGDVESLFQKVQFIMAAFNVHMPHNLSLESLLKRILHLSQQSSVPGVFEWIDGVLVRALERGEWLLLENINYCPSSTLDRLNAILEVDGVLSINEAGTNQGDVRLIKPHPDFRFIATMNSRYGELSRAMRNRCVEIYVRDVNKENLKTAPTDEPIHLHFDRMQLVNAMGIHNSQLSSFMLQAHQLSILSYNRPMTSCVSDKHLMHFCELLLQQAQTDCPTSTFFCAVWSNYQLSHGECVHLLPKFASLYKDWLISFHQISPCKSLRNWSSIRTLPSGNTCSRVLSFGLIFIHLARAQVDAHARCLSDTIGDDLFEHLLLVFVEWSNAAQKSDCEAAFHFLDELVNIYDRLKFVDSKAFTNKWRLVYAARATLRRLLACSRSLRLQQSLRITGASTPIDLSCSSFADPLVHTLDLHLHSGVDISHIQVWFHRVHLVRSLAEHYFRLAKHELISNPAHLPPHEDGMTSLQSPLQQSYSHIAGTLRIRPMHDIVPHFSALLAKLDRVILSCLYLAIDLVDAFSGTHFRSFISAHCELVDKRDALVQFLDIVCDQLDMEAYVVRQRGIDEDMQKILGIVSGFDERAESFKLDINDFISYSNSLKFLLPVHSRSSCPWLMHVFGGYPTISRTRETTALRIRLQSFASRCQQRLNYDTLIQKSLLDLLQKCNESEDGLSTHNMEEQSAKYDQLSKDVEYRLSCCDSRNAIVCVDCTCNTEWLQTYTNVTSHRSCDKCLSIYHDSLSLLQPLFQCSMQSLLDQCVMQCQMLKLGLWPRLVPPLGPIMCSQVFTLRNMLSSAFELGLYKGCLNAHELEAVALLLERMNSNKELDFQSISDRNLYSLLDFQRSMHLHNSRYVDNTCFGSAHSRSPYVSLFVTKAMLENKTIGIGNIFAAKLRMHLLQDHLSLYPNCARIGRRTIRNQRALNMSSVYLRQFGYVLSFIDVLLCYRNSFLDADIPSLDQYMYDLSTLAFQGQTNVISFDTQFLTRSQNEIFSSIVRTHIMPISQLLGQHQTPQVQAKLELLVSLTRLLLYLPVSSVDEVRSNSIQLTDTTKLIEHNLLSQESFQMIQYALQGGFDDSSTFLVDHQQRVDELVSRKQAFEAKFLFRAPDNIPFSRVYEDTHTFVMDWDSKIRQEVLNECHELSALQVHLDNSANHFSDHLFRNYPDYQDVIVPIITNLYSARLALKTLSLLNSQSRPELSTAVSAIRDLMVYPPDFSNDSSLRLDLDAHLVCVQSICQQPQHLENVHHRSLLTCSAYLLALLNRFNVCLQDNVYSGFAGKVHNAIFSRLVSYVRDVEQLEAEQTVIKESFYKYSKTVEQLYTEEERLEMLKEKLFPSFSDFVAAENENQVDMDEENSTVPVLDQQSAHGSNAPEDLLCTSTCASEYKSHVVAACRLLCDVFVPGSWPSLSDNADEANCRELIAFDNCYSVGAAWLAHYSDFFQLPPGLDTDLAVSHILAVRRALSKFSLTNAGPANCQEGKNATVSCCELKVSFKLVDMLAPAAPSEINVLLSVLQKVSTRTCYALQEYPGQEMLLQLLRLVDRIVANPSTSPMRLLLLGAETLLRKSEDWNKFSKSSLSLAAESLELQSIVTKWRRMELESWPVLFRKMEEEIKSTAVESSLLLWSLLNCCFEERKNSTIDQYLHEVHDILNMWLILHSTVGEYEIKLTLLIAFSEQLRVRAVFSQHDLHDSLLLPRLLLRLVNNSVRSCRLLQQNVETVITERVKPLEASLKDLVLLARWDVGNYQQIVASTDSNYRKLVSLCRQYEQILKEPTLSVSEQSFERHMQKAVDFSAYSPMQHHSFSSDANTSQDGTTNDSEIQHFIPEHLLVSVISNFLLPVDTTDVDDAIFVLPTTNRACSVSKLRKRIHAVLNQTLFSRTFLFTCSKCSASIEHLANSIVDRVGQLQLIGNKHQKRTAFTHFRKAIERLGIKWHTLAIRRMSEMVSFDLGDVSTSVSFHLLQQPLDTSLRVYSAQQHTLTDSYALLHTVADTVEQHVLKTTHKFQILNQIIHQPHPDIPYTDLTKGVGFAHFLLSTCWAMRSQIHYAIADMSLLGQWLDVFHFVCSSTFNPADYDDLNDCTAEYAFTLLTQHHDWLLSITSDVKHFQIFFTQATSSPTLNNETYCTNQHLSKALATLNLMKAEASACILVMQPQSVSESSFQLSNHQKFPRLVRPIAVSMIHRHNEQISVILHQLNDLLQVQNRFDRHLMRCHNYSLNLKTHSVRHTPKEPTVSCLDLETKVSELFGCLLLHMQQICCAGSSSGALSSDNEHSNFGAEFNKLIAVLKMTHVGRLANCLQTFADVVANLPPSSSTFSAVRIHMQRLSPVLHQCLLVNQYIIFSSMTYMQSVLKLAYILLCTLIPLTKHGFCQDQQGAESASDETKSDTVQNGTGMGDGQGLKDVSDQIEDEEQLLGNKDEADTTLSNEKPPDIPVTNEDGFEMENDFDAELQDFPEQDGSDNDNASQSSSDLERTMDQVADNQSEVIDEAMWDPKDAGELGQLDQTEEKTGEGERSDRYDSESKVSMDSERESHIETSEASGVPDEKNVDEPINSEPVTDPLATNEQQSDEDTLSKQENKEQNAIQTESEAEMDIDKEDDDVECDNNESDENNPDNDIADEVPIDSLLPNDNQREEQQNATTDILETQLMSEKPSSNTINGNNNLSPHSIDRHTANVNMALSDSGIGNDLNTENDASGSLLSGVDGTGSQQNHTDVTGDSMQTAKHNSRSDEQSELNNDAAWQPFSSTIPNQIPAQYRRELLSSSDKPEVLSSAESIDALTEIFRPAIVANQSDVLFDEAEEPTTDMNFNGPVTQVSADVKASMKSLAPSSSSKRIAQQDKEERNEDVKDLKQQHTTEHVDTLTQQNKMRSQDVPINEVQLTKTVERDELESDMHFANPAGERLKSSSHFTSSPSFHVLQLDTSVISLPNHFNASCSALLHSNDDKIAAKGDGTWSALIDLTVSAAQMLSESLKIILEPTLASRFCGDFKTGKRLNIKKLIPYVASDFRKDKIWLRRVAPFKREYQVLLAIDDSESMRYGQHDRLALLAVATLSQALSMLEVGDLSIMSFGARTSVIHPFKSVWTEQSGNRVCQQFRFSQQSTLWPETVKSIVHYMAESRELQTSISSQHLVQLALLVSDASVQQNRDDIRVWTREAWRANLLLVLIIIDAGEKSIVETRRFTGHSKQPIQHYLDEFPFPLYLVLRHVDQLPEVLSDALRQWFELISR